MQEYGMNITYMRCKKTRPGIGMFFRRYAKKSQKTYVIIILATYTLLWTEYFVSFNSTNKEFNRQYFEGVSNDYILSGLIYDYSYRGRSVYMHFQNYYIVWNKGIASTKIIDYRFGIINRKVNKEILPEHYDWNFNQQGFLEQLPYGNVD